MGTYRISTRYFATSLMTKYSLLTYIMKIYDYKNKMYVGPLHTKFKVAAPWMYYIQAFLVCLLKWMISMNERY